MSTRPAVVLAVCLFAVAQVAGAASGNFKQTDIWRALSRPLHIPQLLAGARCPRTSGGRAAPHTGYTLGHGPVYPVLGFRDRPPAGVVYRSDGGRRWGWNWIKTLWAFDPRYRGPVLIRGRGLDGSFPVHFLIVPRRYMELRVPVRKERNWTYLPSGSGYRHAGCYGLQMDGTSFSRVVVFEIVNR